MTTTVPLGVPGCYAGMGLYADAGAGVRELRYSWYERGRGRLEDTVSVREAATDRPIPIAGRGVVPAGHYLVAGHACTDQEDHFFSVRYCGPGAGWYGCEVACDESQSLPRRPRPVRVAFPHPDHGEELVIWAAWPGAAVHGGPSGEPRWEAPPVVLSAMLGGMPPGILADLIEDLPAAPRPERRWEHWAPECAWAHPGAWSPERATAVITRGLRSPGARYLARGPEDVL